MEPETLLPLTPASTESLERDLAEIDAAIAMVAAGLAVRVRLVGLAAVNELAAVGLARAQSAGVAFSLDRGSEQAPAITVGPRGRSPS